MNAESQPQRHSAEGYGRQQLLVAGKALLDDASSSDAAEHSTPLPAPTADETVSLAGPSLASAAQDAQVPPSIAAVGRYEVLEELGRGGMGVVYKARDPELRRLVAIKMILSGEHADRERLTRFRAEAEAVAKLRHPNIVQIFEIGEQEGRPFFVLEYVEGGNLARRLAGTPQPPRQAAELLEVLARALHAAHTKGIIHRDLKPANVLLSDENQTAGDDAETSRVTCQAPYGIPKIADFGLAKHLAAEAEATAADYQTHSGAIVGTPSYMAPEQAGRAHTASPATDVYALGAILYEALVGRPPFKGETMLDTLEQVRSQEPVAVRQMQPKSPRDLETICSKCLQKEPRKRYDSALDLADDLRRFLDSRPIQARAVGRLERAWRWCRRNRQVAALLAAVVLSLLGGAVVSAIYAIRADQSASHYQAEKRLSDRRLYAVTTNLTHRLIQKAQIGAALEQLDSLRPEHTDGIDLRGWEWFYLKRLCHGELHNLHDHSGEVRSVAFARNGALIASGGDDRIVRIWNTDSGKLLRRLTGHTGQINDVAFSPDGAHIASAAGDTTVRLWEVATGNLLLIYTGHILPVKAVVFHPDGQELATSSDDCTVRLWNRSGKDRLIFQMHLEDRNGARPAFSPDGTRLAALSGGGLLRIWETSSGEQVLKHRDPRIGHGGLAFSPDGKRLAFPGADRKIHLVDAASGAVEASLADPPVRSAAVIFDPFSQWLASGGGSDNTLHIWDLGKAKEARALRGHFDSIAALAVSSDGKRLVSAGKDGLIKVWDAEAEQSGRTLRGHQAYVNSLAFLGDGRLVSGSADHSVRIWDPKAGAHLQTLGRHTIKLEPSRDDYPGRLSSITTHEGHTGIVRGVSTSADDKWIVSIANEKLARVWDSSTGEQKGTFEPALRDPRGVLFYPDGQRVAALSPGQDISVWNVWNQQVALTIPTRAAKMQAATLDRTGAWLATAGSDHLVRLWDANTGQELRSFAGHTDTVSAVQFSDDGRLLASGGEDRTIRLWDVNTGEALLTCRGHSGAVNGLAFSPDKRRLASTGGGLDDRTLKIWDLGTAQELLTLGDCYAPVRFSPDGQRIVCSGGPWNTIKVFETDPVDDLPYRLGRAPLPSPNKQSYGHEQNDVSPAADAKLKVLGYYTAPKLPASRNSKGPPGYSMKKADGTFLVAVVSVPHHYLMPSEEKHKALQEKRKSGNPEVQPREQMAILSAKPFQLVLADGRKVTGVLYSDWPLQPRMGQGFLSPNFNISYFTPVTAAYRRGLAIAFPIRAADAEGLLQLQIGTETPVPIPSLRLQVPAGPEPT